MHRPNIITPPHTFRSFLEELATYVSLFTPLLGALIALWGLSEANYLFLLYAVLPMLIGIVWLFSQYRRAKFIMAREGVVQRPAWLWRLLTNKIPHKSEQLSDSLVMVFVPPNKESYATQLEEEYNRNGNHILLFHFIPQPENGEIDEDKGTVSVGGEIRPLTTLMDEMNDCAAVVLLDDTKWGTYAQTMKVVEDWTKRHTVRPVHVEGRGTLNYSWNRLEDLVGNNHSLKNRLLAQSANRGARWFWQARLYRRIVLWTLGLACLFSLATLLITRNAVMVKKRTADQNTQLEKSVSTLDKIVSSDPSGQQDISRAFEAYRTSLDKPESERLRLLLKVHADQMVKTLVAASGRVEAVSGNAMMFSVEAVSNGNWTIREVAATRIPPSDEAFAVPLNPSDQTTDIDGIVSCAVVSRAFILWSGKWNGNNVETTNMEGWDLEGKPTGSFQDGKLNIGNYRCKYAKRPREDLHRRILCAPVGLDLNSYPTKPAGAICVTYSQDVAFLNESWVRQTIARYGSSLSFASWERALPVRGNAALALPRNSRPRRRRH
jgi:hypothetical protein